MKQNTPNRKYITIRIYNMTIRIYNITIRIYTKLNRIEFHKIINIKILCGVYNKTK